MDVERAAQQPAGPGPANSGSAGGLLGLFNRVFSRHTMNMSLLAVLPIIFASSLNWTAGLLYDPDLWWHLANARIVAVDHHFVRADPFSFTLLGQQWTNWEWLSELAYWFSYRVFALRGIYLLTWLVLAANVLLVYWRGFRSSRHRGAALWAAGVAFILMSISSGPRCINLAYLALSAEMAVLEAADRGNRRALWLLPPLFCLCVNLHGIWFIGIAILVLYVLCGLVEVNSGVFEQKAFSPPDRNRLLAVLAVSVIALMANPYGWRILWSPVDMILNQGLLVGVVDEWQPMRLTSAQGIGAVAAIGLMLLANCLRGRKWTIFEIAIVFLAWFAAFDHVRFAFLAAILTTPLLAQDIERSFCTEPDTKTIPAMNALMVAGCLCAVWFIFPSEATLEKRVAESFPMHLIDSIQPSWRTFNLDHAGGMMDFEGKPVFVDSRFELFAHGSVLQDYINAVSVHDSLALLDKYRVDHVLTIDGLPLSYLLQRTSGWREVSREKAGDGVFLLYARSSDHAEQSEATPSPMASQNH
jgi:hypothetical protein